MGLSSFQEKIKLLPTPEPQLPKTYLIESQATHY